MWVSFNATVIVAFSTVKINVPVNTVFFHPPYSKHKPCKTTVSLQFRPNPTSTQLWMHLASLGNWRAGHLTPWVFDIDFQLTTKPFCTVFGLPPPFPFYCIFYLPRRTPSHSLLLHQHFYCTPVLTRTVLCTFCIFLPRLLFVYPQWQVELSSCGKGEARVPHQNLLCFWASFCLELASSIFQASILAFVESGKESGKSVWSIKQAENEI